MSSLHTAIPTPSFCSFWHGHPYIPIHFLKMFFILYYMSEGIWLFCHSLFQVRECIVAISVYDRNHKFCWVVYESWKCIGDFQSHFCIWFGHCMHECQCVQTPTIIAEAHWELETPGKGEGEGDIANSCIVTTFLHSKKGEGGGERVQQSHA